MTRWLIGVGLSMAVVGCASRGPVELQSPTCVNGLTYVLVSQTNVYFVEEPFRLSLHVKNVSERKQTLPVVLSEGYKLYIRGPGGNEGNSQAVGDRQMREEDLDILPGESRIIDLKRSMNNCCFSPGLHQVSYCYFGTHGGGDRKPSWITPAVTIRCIEQPIVIPEGTDIRVTQALRKLQDSPGTGFFSSRPGWTTADYSEPMTQLSSLGKVAVPALLANLQNFAMEISIIQLLGDLKVKEAVPFLLDRLWIQDDPHDSLIIAKLAEITGHPDGYGFHRHWFDKRTQEDAVKAYRDWWISYKEGFTNATTKMETQQTNAADLKH